MTIKKLVLNKEGVRQLLRSDEMVADLRRRARNIANAAGPGHRIDVGKGRYRARAAVITDTLEARLAEAHRRSLTSAIDAGRR